ncbi:MAG: hypothetical protein JW751_14585 [Polyangiaceae bacterium]|nr:hypothetical protein [Polyangiaceae bacterium]
MLPVGAVDARRGEHEESAGELGEEAIPNVLVGMGEDGCPIQSPLEAQRRLLAEPEPFRIDDGGFDQEVLAARDEALRGNAELIVIVQGDRDDCSVADSSEGARLSAAL